MNDLSFINFTKKIVEKRDMKIIKTKKEVGNFAKIIFNQKNGFPYDYFVGRSIALGKIFNRAERRLIK